MREIFAGIDGGEDYVKADVVVRQDVEQITVESEEHPGESIIEPYPMLRGSICEAHVT